MAELNISGLAVLLVFLGTLGLGISWLFWPTPLAVVLVAGGLFALLFGLWLYEKSRARAATTEVR